MDWFRSIVADEKGNFKPVNLLLGILCLVGFLGAVAVVSAIGMYVLGQTARATDLAFAGILGLVFTAIGMTLTAGIKSVNR